jgi:hypothetical protein
MQEELGIKPKKDKEKRKREKQERNFLNKNESAAETGAPVWIDTPGLQAQPETEKPKSVAHP